MEASYGDGFVFKTGVEKAEGSFTCVAGVDPTGRLIVEIVMARSRTVDQGVGYALMDALKELLRAHCGGREVILALWAMDTKAAPWFRGRGFHAEAGNAEALLMDSNAGARDQFLEAKRVTKKEWVQRWKDAKEDDEKDALSAQDFHWNRDTSNRCLIVQCTKYPMMHQLVAAASSPGAASSSSYAPLLPPTAPQQPPMATNRKRPIPRDSAPRRPWGLHDIFLSKPPGLSQGDGRRVSVKTGTVVWVKFDGGGWFRGYIKDAAIIWADGTPSKLVEWLRKHQWRLDDGVEPPSDAPPPEEVDEDERRLLRSRRGRSAAGLQGRLQAGGGRSDLKMHIRRVDECGEGHARRKRPCCDEEAARLAAVALLRTRRRRLPKLMRRRWRRRRRRR